MQDIYSLKHWNHTELLILKSIALGKWPTFSAKPIKVLGELQKEICRLSVRNEDEKALKLINFFSARALIRFWSINLFAQQREVPLTTVINGHLLKTSTCKLIFFF
jgi:hypothetical protein